jgi:hypothetical protein
LILDLVPEAAMSLLTDYEEVLFRQIHPLQIEKGVPHSSQFCPNPKDENKLSVDRSSITSASASFELYQRLRETAAVYGISVGEFGAEKINCYSDPTEATESSPENSAHALADFTGTTTTRSEMKNLAKRLKHLAIARGKLHPPNPA